MTTQETQLLDRVIVAVEPLQDGLEGFGDPLAAGVDLVVNSFTILPQIMIATVLQRLNAKYDATGELKQ